MKAQPLPIVLAVSLMCSTAWPQAVSPQADRTDRSWQQEFDLASCTLATTGRNRFFVLEPGFQLVLEGGNRDGGHTRVQITVLDETRQVAGVGTRVVEEREWKDGELYEVSRNYFALCRQTGDVFYFGEDVDYYENGRVVKHDGSWLAGTGGNRAGLAMPGTPRAGMRYYQEVAPGVAMDRAEIVSLNETCQTPAGTFSNCMKVGEDNPLEPGGETEYKYYAPDVGLLQDEELRLTAYGFVGRR
jgi:hypothetical protein